MKKKSHPKKSRSVALTDTQWEYLEARAEIRCCSVSSIVQYLIMKDMTEANKIRSEKTKIRRSV